ncbi:hypothetical protein EDEG_02646 [Edhazardia aedis USNM 41457]|uniref:Uncharacterized protein n=1 Tax=Edhazardia aedis (strain USNM 41457) TaxID=1003232 RepID=J9DNP1_EDHAE|nr:hypothetical protein EDEG_02646 [Edhazardia aedis USNM 41457]|eukprot:EJW03002.1 hypothetical protein EDEG_02646 [Edhazardia aedis USNM 41457]
MLESIAENLKSNNKELRTKIFTYMLQMDIKSLLKMKEQLLDVYENQRNSSSHEKMAICDILQNVNSYEELGNYEVFKYSYYNDMNIIIFSDFFARSVLDYMNDCQKNNILHINFAKNKAELCSIIIPLRRLILSKYQAKNTDFNYIAKLGAKLFAPFMKNNMPICCYFASNIEPESEGKHTYDTILNICLLKKEFNGFLRYFLKYGRTMPLYNEMGIRICGDQKKRRK